MPNETPWTPGPWRVRQTSLHPSIVSDAGPICNFGSARTYRDVTLANARLIAAAPELYEALDEAVKCSDMLAEREGWERVPEADAMLTKMRAALAKALGQ